MNKKKIIIIAAAVLLVLALAGLAFFLVHKYTMIKVVGMDKKDAIEKMNSDTFIKYKTVEKDEDEAFNHEKGYVYKQSVPSGSVAGSVKLYCAQGFRYPLPDLQGKIYSKLTKEEKDALAKFDTVNVYEEYADSAKGEIISVTYGDYYGKVPKEEPINIYVCKARVPHVDMLEGDNWYKVKKYFKGANINVRKELGKKKGEIKNFVQTACKKGEKVKVNVIISDGKGVNVPDVTGKSEKKATKKLNKAGVKYKIKYVYQDMYSNARFPRKKVKSQSDTGLIKKNKRVTLKVSKPGIKVNQINLDVNSAGGVETDIKFSNISGKKINYVTFTIRYYNRIGDPINDEINGGYEARLRYTGPLSPGSSADPHWGPEVYDYSTAAAAPYSATIEYKDGSEQEITFMKKYKSYRYWYMGDFKGDDIHDPDMED